MVEVQSSTVKAVDFDGKDLTVKFVSGASYKYIGVSKKVYEDFLAAESKGKYLNENIKTKYTFQKEA